MNLSLSGGGKPPAKEMGRRVAHIPHTRGKRFYRGGERFYRGVFSSSLRSSPGNPRGEDMQRWRIKHGLYRFSSLKKRESTRREFSSRMREV